MIYAIQMWLYVDAASEDEAKKHKAKLESLLKSPMGTGFIQAQRIPLHSIVVMDPAVPSK